MGTISKRRLAALSVCGLLASGCGGNDGESANQAATAPDQTSTEQAASAQPEDGTYPSHDPDVTEEVVRLASARGVTEDQIFIGVAPTDNEGLNELFNLGYGTVPVERMHDAWAAAVNEAGGIHGREIVPVVEPVISIGGYIDEACVALTEDNELFVVTGAFSADSWLCITEAAGIPYVGHFGETPERQRRSGGLMFAAEMSQIEMRIAAVQMMIDEGVFDDRRVGLWAEEQDEDYAVAVRPLLNAAGVDVVAFSALDEFGTDVIQIQSNLQLALEQFRAEDVELILNLSDVVSLLTVVDELGADFDIALTSGRATNAAQIAEIETSTDVKERTFAITFDKPGFDGWIADAGFQDCLTSYDERFPNDPINLEDAESRRQFGEQCQGWALTMMLLDAAGPNPTVESFVEGGESLGTFTLPGMSSAVLGPDKHSAGNDLRRYEYDNAEDTLLPVGVPITLG